MKSGRSGRDSERREGRGGRGEEGGERREGRGGRDERWASEMGSVWRRREVRVGYTVQSHHFIVHSGTQIRSAVGEVWMYPTADTPSAV